MPSGRGIAVLLVGGAGLLLGWLFGLPEASFAGVAAIASVVLAAVVLLVLGSAPEVRRTARPGRLAVDDPCEIVLDAANVGRRPSPVTELIDEVGEQGRAQVLLRSLRPGERAAAVYSLASRRRGLHVIGPLRSRVEDPFRLVHRTWSSAAVTAVVVVPRTLGLDPLPAAVGDEPELGVHSMVAASTVDEEFTGLRAYVPGDDLRRIHWPSTARAGSAQVRQFEVPWQHRTTLVVDLRSSRHDHGSFERMVTVAASVVALSAAESELLRFGSTLDADPPFVPAAPQMDGLLDRLAVLEPHEASPTDEDGLVAAIERATASATGRLVVCTGELPSEEMGRVRTAASRTGLAVIVSTGAAATTQHDAPESDGPAEVRWDGHSDLPEVWRAARDRARPVSGRRT